MAEQSCDGDYRDDTPPWERLEPAEWLREPHFRDEGWIDEVQRIISEGRKAKRKESKALSPQEIVQLEVIVAQYIKEKVDWNGFLNNGERDALEKVQEKAGRLRDALNGLQKAQGEKERPPIWYLELTLAGQGTRDGQEDDPANLFEQGRKELRTLEARLDSIADMEIKSPVFDDAEHSRPGWPSPTESKVRARLQVQLDHWWVKTAALSKAKDHGKAEAFHEFLADTFRRILLPNAPGADGAAIKRARQDGLALEKAEEEADRAWREKRARLGKALARLAKR